MPASKYIVEPAEFRESLETTKGLVILWKSKESAPGLDALRDLFAEMDGVTILPEVKEWPKGDQLPHLSSHRWAPPPTVLFVDNPHPPPPSVKQEASLIVTCYPNVGDNKLVTVKYRTGDQLTLSVVRNSDQFVPHRRPVDALRCPEGPSLTLVSKPEVGFASVKNSLNIQSDNQKTQLKALNGFIDYTDEAVTMLDAAGREFIKLTVAGDATVRGEEVARDQRDVYDMFRAWVQAVAKPPEPMANHDAAIQRDALVKAMDDMARLFRADGNHNGADFVEATRDFALRPPAAPKYTLRGTHSGRLSSAAPNESAKPMPAYQGFSVKVEGKEIGRIREWKPGPLPPDAVGVTLSEPRREFFTGSPSTAKEELDRLRSAVRAAARSWEKGAHVGNLFQSLEDLTGPRLSPEDESAAALIDRIAASGVPIPHSSFYALMAGDMNAVFRAAGRCSECRHPVPLKDGRCHLCTPLSDAERVMIDLPPADEP